MSDSVKLSNTEIFKFIAEVLSGERYYYSEYLKETLIFINPTCQQRMQLDLLESRLVAQYISEGYITEDDLTNDIFDSFFSLKDSEELAELDSKIKSYEILLKKRIKGTPSYKEESDKLNQLKNQRSLLFNKKEQIKQFTAEFKAREDKYLNIMVRCTLNESRQQRWKSIQDLDSSFQTLNPLYEFLDQYLSFYFGLGDKLIRRIARSHQWRNYYIAGSKGVIKLFDKPAQELSINQLELMAWSAWYNDIFEMSFKDRPDLEIIEEDERLDKYMDEYSRKVKAEINASKKDSMLDSIGDKSSQDLIVTAESANFVKFKKQDLYSDTAIITGRADKNSKVYSPEMERKKRKNKSR